MGGRGASSSATTNATTKSLFNNSNREQRPDVRVRASNVKLDNKNSVIDFVKRQTGIDLSKVVEPRTSRSRTYLGVHLEDLTKNQQNEVRRVLNAYGRKTRIGDNGGYGYAIYYQK